LLDPSYQRQVATLLFVNQRRSTATVQRRKHDRYAGIIPAREVNKSKGSFLSGFKPPYFMPVATARRRFQIDNRSNGSGSKKSHADTDPIQFEGHWMKSRRAVAGIDIGGDRKGNHLVILRGTEIVCNVHKETPEHMLEKCVEFDVAAVGIDAPCQWRTGEAGRQAEKALARQRIFSFATPTRELAMASQSGFYRWMFNGERIYNALTPHFPLYGGHEKIVDKVCFETFPHAITCALLKNEVASAKQKRTQRRQILEEAGIQTTSLRSIDEIDAALCALTANFLLEGKVVAHGDESGGFIVVPASSR
jgi:predicted nuclease with RNAse H fold